MASVPHSGTRTLVQRLGISPKDFGCPIGRWWHFGNNDAVIRQYKDVHLHIPVRHPVEVASSWARRGKNVNALVTAYRSMFKHLDRPHTLYCMEDLPALAGTEDRDRNISPWLIDEYVGILFLKIVIPHFSFFEQFYGKSQVQEQSKAMVQVATLAEYQARTT